MPVAFQHHKGLSPQIFIKNEISQNSTNLLAKYSRRRGLLYCYELGINKENHEVITLAIMEKSSHGRIQFHQRPGWLWHDASSGQISRNYLLFLSMLSRQIDITQFSLQYID
jgi:hypothetical protein